MGSGTFTQADEQSLEAEGDIFDLLIYGTFVGSVDLETQAPNGDWLSVQSFSSETVLLNQESASIRKWRLTSGGITSGEINYLLDVNRYNQAKA